MLNLVEDIKSISYVKSHTANLLKILSIGENDIKNKRVYSHEQVQKKVKAILE
jgi:hypothetical protein